ncbi:MAG: histidine--tRNA ligase [Bacillota bacterium]|nr:histidine--tRNA ligase [Bacillota bacterium]
MGEKIQKLKGTADVTPDQSFKWQYVESILRDIAKRFGYHEIRIPTFERTELFLRGIGDTTDVVQKEMYTFLDKSDRSVTLRPEGTASVVRAFVENSLYAGVMPFKVYYIVPNFRYEKPQAGRLREHHQFGIECFGAKGPAADAEVIAVIDTILKRLGITGVSVRVNSIGCPDCRVKYVKALKEYFETRKGDLCPTCLERLEKNPMRILDCKSPICGAIAKEAPKTIDYLCGDCTAHFEEVLRCLIDLDVKFEVDPGIVRGLDYYNRTVFEFYTDTIGAQGTICGGGRYDGLVSLLGGPDTPALGFGCGLERLLLTMEACGAKFPEVPAPDIYIAGIGDNAKKAVRKLCHELRLNGVAAEYDLCDRGVKLQVRHADRLGAKYKLVIGEDELLSGYGKIEDMNSNRAATTRLSVDSITRAVKGLM